MDTETKKNYMPSLPCRRGIKREKICPWDMDAPPDNIDSVNVLAIMTDLKRGDMVHYTMTLT